MALLWSSIHRVWRIWNLERETRPFDGDTERLLKALCGPSGWKEAASPSDQQNDTTGPVVIQNKCYHPSDRLGNVNFWLTGEDAMMYEILCRFPASAAKFSVLFLVAPGEFNAIGGGQVQLLRTVQELAQLGVRCLVTDRLDLPIDYDVVHIWALDHFHQINAIKHVRKPKVISTIYWNYTELFSLKAALRQISRAASLGSLEDSGNIDDFLGLRFRDRQYYYHRLFLWRSRISNRDLVQSCDFCLPNCQREKEWINKDFGITDDRIVIVPNGADAQENPDNLGEPFRGKFPEIGDYLLCVGRIEDNKNQLMTILALRDLGLDLVFIGNEEKGSVYSNLCRAAAGNRPNIHFLGQLDRSMVYAAYRNAKAHVLPSWSETPGLANLEAALNGCPIVCGNIGAEQEYFGKAARYCYPGSIPGIRKAVLDCLEDPQSPERTRELKHSIQEEYTWKRAGETTMGVYENCLGQQAD